MALTDNIIGHWHLNGNLIGDNGSPSLSSFSGAFFTTPAKLGSNSVYFDGIDDYGTMPSLSINMQDTISMAIWVKIPVDGDSARIISFTNGLDRQMFIGTVSDKLRVFGRGTSEQSTTVVDTITVNDDAWHLVVGVFNEVAGRVQLYVDDRNLGSSTGAAFNSGTFNSRLLGKYFGDTQFFKGYIDEIVIWNRILNSGEVLELWNSGAGTEMGATPSVDNRPTIHIFN